MKPEQIEYYRKAAEEGTIPDAQNPLHILQGTDVRLLTQIANRQLDMVALARHELQQRGLNNEGKWVGFAEAKKEQAKNTAKNVRRKGRGL